METIPCKNCITYPLCAQKPKVTCPFLNDYTLTFTAESDELMGDWLHPGWKVDFERLNNVCNFFNTTHYHTNYSTGELIIYPGVLYDNNS